MQASLYPRKSTLILLTFVASVYMLFHARPLKIVRALTSPDFYIVLLVSFCIGLLITLIVDRTSRWLDRSCPWHKMPLERAILQFTVGVVVPGLLDLLLISIYFETLDQNIIDNQFLIIDYPVIISFIILLNLYYLIHYLLQSRQNYGGHRDMKSIFSARDYRGSDNLRDKEMGKALHVEHYGLKVNLPLQNILCFYRSGKKVRVLMNSENEYEIVDSISGVAERYSEFGIVQINRSMAINLLIVKGYEIGDKRNTLKLIIKPLYSDIYPTAEDKEYLVTKEYIDTFKEQFSIYSTNFNFLG